MPLFSQTPRITPEQLLDLQTPKATLGCMLELASYAPSVHNSQPWRVSVHQLNKFRISINQTIQLPEADPTGRGQYMAIGAFLESVIITTEALGQTFNLKLFPDQLQQSTIADIELQIKEKISLDKQSKDTLSALSRRATNRGLFTTIPDVRATVKELTQDDITGAGVTFRSDSIGCQTLAKLIREGTHIAYKSRAFCSEHADWIRTNWTRRKDGIPGYAIGLPTIVSFIVPHAIKYKDVSDMRTKQEYKKALSTNLFAIISSEDTKEGWVATGRRLQRLLVRATLLNLEQSPNAAPIEMGDLRTEVKSLTNSDGKPQLLIRIGNGTPLKNLTPRKPLTSFVTWET